MKIGLVAPTSASAKGVPLGLAYLASYLMSQQPDIDVSILDIGVSSRKEINAFLNTPFNLVGLTSTYRTFLESVSFAKEVKNRHKNSYTVVGGPHVSIIYGKALDSGAFDFAVFGEGEITFNELVNAISLNTLTPEHLRQINGIIFKYEDRTVVTNARAFITNIDTLPLPAYALCKMHRYDSYPVITSRGCPFNCVFCCAGEIWKRKTRLHNVNRVIEEIKSLISHYPGRRINFSDDSFNLTTQRARDICDRILAERLDFAWSCDGFRVDKIDLSTAKKMREAGCISVALGLESANPIVLKNIRKGITIETARENIETMRIGGIPNIVGQFMIGNPGDTLNTVKESLKFARESGLTKVNFYSALPFPTTALWDFVLSNGRFLVEPDVTKFEEVEPRVIFETNEFPKQDRIEAIRLATEAGYYLVSVSRNKWYQFLMSFLSKLLPTMRIGKFNLGKRIFSLLLIIRNKLGWRG